MTDDFRRLGTDLALLANLETQKSRERGSDLQTLQRPASGGIDLALHGSVENLQQALLLRFLTPAGELEPLGHRTYGSRLFDLLGEPNNQATRNRAKLFALQALADEPRVAEVLALEVRTRRSEPTRIDIAAELKVLGRDTPLNLVFPFFLEGGPSP